MFMWLHDQCVLLWVRVTVCWRYGHRPWLDEDYCRNCGKDTPSREGRTSRSPRESE
jgi:hypothetical protein